MSDEDDRKAILGRRNRLIAIALTGLSSASCYQSHGPGDVLPDGGEVVDSGIPVPCLSRPLDAGPFPCLEPPLEDAGPDAAPTPCLEAPFDAGSPAPCLGAPLEDAGPTVCLAFYGDPDDDDAEA